MSAFESNLKILVQKYANKFAVLNVAIDHSNNELSELYREHVNKHNFQILNDEYPNSGFDVFVPQDILFNIPYQSTFVNMGIKTAMLNYDSILKKMVPTGFNVHPRSSISKTPLMLANHTGIIDMGYRGSIIAALRLLPLQNGTKFYTVEKHTRLVQICHPSLYPIYVNIVNENELSCTSRGEGCFGSTGL
jgi:dUTP pyrophosphatase